MGKTRLGDYEVVRPAVSQPRDLENPNKQINNKQFNTNGIQDINDKPRLNFNESCPV